MQQLHLIFPVSVGLFSPEAIWVMVPHGWVSDGARWSRPAPPAPHTQGPWLAVTPNAQPGGSRASAVAVAPHPGAPATGLPAGLLCVLLEQARTADPAGSELQGGSGLGAKCALCRGNARAARQHSELDSCVREQAVKLETQAGPWGVIMLQCIKRTRILPKRHAVPIVLPIVAA